MTLRFALIPLVLIAACSEEHRDETTPPPPPPDTGALAKFALGKDPGEALGVMDVREKGDADEVVVVGRIGLIVKGFASFQLVDEALDYCGYGTLKDDKCPTPWDYCCTPPDQKNEGTLLVEAHDEKGVLKAATLPGLRLLDTVVVKGKRTVDEHGNVTIRATGWHRRERPTLREGLHWPE